MVEASSTAPAFILYPFIHLGSKDCQNLDYPAPLDQNRLMDKLRMLTPTSGFINQHPSQQILWVIPIPTKFWQQLWVICSFTVTATSSLSLPSTVKDGVWCPFAYLGCQYRKTCRSNISEQKRWGSKELEMQTVFQMLEYLHLLNEMS